MIGFEEQIEFLELVGKELEKEVECYAIGGTALLFLGLKDSTKDVDLVFEEEGDRDLMKEALERLGFKENKEEMDLEIYGRKEAIRIEPILLGGHGSRFDLFLKDIISFQLSGAMKNNVEEKHEFDNLTMYVISPEYIILLKCATDRKGDRVDAKNIIENIEINWEKVIDEAQWQTEEGRKIFSVFLYDFLMDLKEDFDTNIPNKILKKLRKIGERKMLEALKKKD